MMNLHANVRRCDFLAFAMPVHQMCRKQKQHKQAELNTISISNSAERTDGKGVG